jgi:hypothetical protein
MVIIYTFHLFIKNYDISIIKSLLIIDIINKFSIFDWNGYEWIYTLKDL